MSNVIGYLHGKPIIGFSPLGNSGSFTVHYADGGAGIIGRQGVNEWFAGESARKQAEQIQEAMESLRPKGPEDFAKEADSMVDSMAMQNAREQEKYETNQQFRDYIDLMKDKYLPKEQE